MVVHIYVNNEIFRSYHFPAKKTLFSISVQSVDRNVRNNSRLPCCFSHSRRRVRALTLPYNLKQPFRSLWVSQIQYGDDKAPEVDHVVRERARGGLGSPTLFRCIVYHTGRVLLEIRGPGGYHNGRWRVP